MSSVMETFCSYLSMKRLLVLFILGLMIMPSSCAVFPNQPNTVDAYGPQTDLYLRFRKSSTANNNRQHRSEEIAHIAPFIRFRKSVANNFQDPYQFLYPSYVPTRK